MKNLKMRKDKDIDLTVMNSKFKQGLDTIEFMKKPLVTNNLYVCFS